MLLKIIWDLCMNSFAPKNIPFHLILSSWDIGIDSPLVAPKSMGFGFKPLNSQKLVPEWNEDNIVLDTWRAKPGIFQVIVQWGFSGDHFKGWLLIFSTDSKYFAAFEWSRDFSEWLPNGLMLSFSSESNSFLRSLQISPYLIQSPWFSAWRCLPSMSAIATNSQCF